MAEAIVGPLVSKLQELALSEGRALVAVSGEIGTLRDKLMWLLAFLQEADPRRRTRASELMRVLVRHTRDAAFSAEDAVDEYVFCVDLSRYPSWSRAILGFLAGSTTQLLVRHRLSGEIAAINGRLEEIIKNKEKYRLDDSAAVSSVRTWTASAASSSVSLTWNVSKPQIIGREKEQSKLKEKLLNSDAHLEVIYVLGESGVGRTMLVNSVCQKSTIRDQFEVSAMVKVPRKAGVSNILKSIWENLKKTQSVEEQDNIEQPGRSIVQIVKSHLAGRRYLVVIDGREMTITDWNAVIHALPNEETSSRVVLITKKKPHFLNHVKHYHEDTIELKGLQYEDCKELFHTRLHGGEEEEAERDEYYKQVHNITGGLPLAVILLSGLMHNKEFPDEWDSVFKYLVESAKSKRLDKILSLSFEDLHHELKLCFLYFTAFLERNSKAYRSTLVKLWVAEGFLAPRDGKTAEELGHIYLSQLIVRGLVAETASGDDSFRLLALHNSSVQSFARSEAQEASFMEMHQGDHVPEPATVRRLTLHNSMDRYGALDNTMPKLRSIIAIFQEERETTANPPITGCFPSSCFPCCCFPALCSGKHNIRKSVLTKLLQGSKFLRVIMLEGMEIGTELPKEIGSMVHLRYLGARCQSLKTIHASIGKLSNLQTMDVKNSSVRELPLPFWKIISLRHVTGDKLIIPRRAGELKQLKTLDSVRTSEDWDGKILTRMVNLEIVDVIVQGKLKEHEFSHNLSKLNYLTTLKLEVDGLPVNIFTEACSLQCLKTLPNLNDLSLSKMQLHKWFIKRLGELPCLTKLSLLLGVSYEDEEGKLEFQHDGFHCLRILVDKKSSISFPLFLYYVNFMMLDKPSIKHSGHPQSIRAGESIGNHGLLRILLGCCYKSDLSTWVISAMEDQLLQPCVEAHEHRR
ncbi:Disease resistance protein RPM1 [Triticum urartu]|uniref:Disease resistance protein RPM1 n=1 Tax=Triticum urartu TaxID=4572 RepID=M8A9T7_TRIUA|nr:Disease resistance protein RPM1 [Triticum urartu]